MITSRKYRPRSLWEKYDCEANGAELRERSLPNDDVHSLRAHECHSGRPGTVLCCACPKGATLTPFRLKELFKQSQDLKFEYPDCEVKDNKVLSAAATLKKLDYNAELSPERADMVKTIWADPGIKATFERRSLFHGMDSLDYFLDDIDRVPSCANVNCVFFL